MTASRKRLAEAMRVADQHLIAATQLGQSPADIAQSIGAPACCAKDLRRLLGAIAQRWLQLQAEMQQQKKAEKQDRARRAAAHAADLRFARAMRQHRSPYSEGAAL